VCTTIEERRGEETGIDEEELGFNNISNQSLGRREKGTNARDLKFKCRGRGVRIERSEKKNTINAKGTGDYWAAENKPG